MSAPLSRHSRSGHSESMDLEPSLLADPDPENADSLVSSNDPDDMANEQTWPTEEEMGGARDGLAVGGVIPDASQGTTPKAVKRVPQGTSEYQAAWIVDESDEEDDRDRDERSSEEGEMEMEDTEAEEMVELPVKDVEDADMETDGRRSIAFQDLDLDEEDRQ